MSKFAFVFLAVLLLAAPAAFANNETSTTAGKSAQTGTAAATVSSSTTTPSTHSGPTTASAKSSMDIIANVSSNSSFKTLTSLLQTAGLTSTLQGTGPFTLFAPTDAAFAKLPAATLANLQKPENKAELTRILSYHVVSGKMLSSNFSGKKSNSNTVAGSSISIDGTSKGLRINNASATGSEIVASNGVIHTIDTVLMPPAQQTPAN